MIPEARELVDRLKDLITGLNYSGDPRTPEILDAFAAGKRRSTAVPVEPELKGAIAVKFYLRNLGYTDLLSQIGLQPSEQDANNGNDGETNLLSMIASAKVTEAQVKVGKYPAEQPVLFLKFGENLQRAGRQTIYETDNRRIFINREIPFAYEGIGRFEKPIAAEGVSCFGYTQEFLRVFSGNYLDRLRQAPLETLLKQLFSAESGRNKDLSVRPGIASSYSHPFISDYEITYRGQSLIRVKLRDDGIIMNTVDKYNGFPVSCFRGYDAYPEYLVALNTFTNISSWIGSRVRDRKQIHSK